MVRRPLLILGTAAALLLSGCGGGGGGGGAQTTAKTTEDVTIGDLPSMVLVADDFPAELAGFARSEERDIPNAVKANTGGDDKPVTLDDPEYGDNLADMNRWGRLGGYRVKFTRDAPTGEPEGIEIELSLTKAEDGAHDFFVGWIASDPRRCLEVGDESDCSGISLQNADTGENYVTRWANFRTGRIVAEVSVDATLSSGQEDTSQLDDTVQQLAALLFTRIQEQL